MFYVLSTSSVTVTDLMLVINQRCYHTAMGVKTQTQNSLYLPSVQVFSIFIMHNETQCIPKSQFYYLFLIQRHIKRWIKKECKTGLKHVSKTSRETTGTDLSMAYVQIEAFSPSYYTHRHTHIQMRHGYILQFILILPAEATTLSPKSSHYHRASSTSRCLKVHIPFITPQSCWGLSHIECYQCSCPPFEGVHAGVTPRKLVDFFKCHLWHEAGTCRKIRDGVLSMEQHKITQKKDVKWYFVYLFKKTRACIVQGK